MAQSTKTAMKHTAMQNSNSLATPEQLTLFGGMAPPTLRSRNRAEREQYALDILTGRRKLSYSAFAKFMDSPDAFIRNRLDRVDKNTVAMLEGKVFHCLVLEPQKFDAEYIAEFEGKRPSSAQQQKFMQVYIETDDASDAYSQSYSTKGKSPAKIAEEAKELVGEFANYLNFLKIQGTRIEVKRKMLTKCLTLADAVMQEPKARELITGIHDGGHAEHKVEWEYKGIQWVGYLDGLKPDEYIADLKKCVNANYRKVQSAVTFDGWGNQGALYSLGMGMWDKPYYIIAADADFQVSVNPITKEQRVRAMRTINWYMDRFFECLVDPDLFTRSFGFYASNGMGAPE